MSRSSLSLTVLACVVLAGCSPGKTIDTSSGAYGKAASDAVLPPQGHPPAPGADMSKRGGAAGTSGSASAPR